MRGAGERHAGERARQQHGAPSGSMLRPLANALTAVFAVSHAARLLVKLLIATLLVASVVQLSASLVMNAVPFQYCVSSGTGSRTSCEPLAFLSASRPKRILLLPTRTRSLLSAGTLVSRLRSAARSVTPSVSAGRTPSRNDSNGPSGEARLTARSTVKLPIPPTQVPLEVPDGTLAVSAVAANGGVASARSTAPKPKFAYTVPSRLANVLAVV